MGDPARLARSRRSTGSPRKRSSSSKSGRRTRRKRSSAPSRKFEIPAAERFKVSVRRSDRKGRDEMSKRKRTVIAIIVIELLLAGAWIWLHTQAVTSPRATADSARAIGLVFGG